MQALSNLENQKSVSQFRHSYLFLNAATGQKPINIYSFLLPISPNSSCCLWWSNDRKSSIRGARHNKCKTSHFEKPGLTAHSELTLHTCLSVAGFQSGSKSTNRLPPIKFKPQPPALLLSRKANSFCEETRSSEKPKYHVIDSHCDHIC